MVIGNGLIAKAFMKDYRDDGSTIIFASGVSYSFETRVEEFKREETLLMRTLLRNRNKRVVYFSSFVDANSKKRAYSLHKLCMESVVVSSGNPYIILKLPQVIGCGGNQHTLINFIRERLQSGNVIPVYKDTYRSIIDVEDIKRIVDFLLDVQQDDNMVYMEFPYIEKTMVLDVVNMMAFQYGAVPKIKMVDVPKHPLPELSDQAKAVLKGLHIIPHKYTENAIKKYMIWQ